ncbi:uncharacterized protein LOC101058692 [Pan troglodytes]|uniref:Uncharacterized protein n=1 Tax=Pan troglodytes TaxID=9598 RepID=G2HEB6_PANTR|nr:uncharacterized protein LOC101058692 [Pan troglodytes]BAK62074.1 hypothetical protein [Pan troglodytes]
MNTLCGHIHSRALLSFVSVSSRVFKKDSIVWEVSLPQPSAAPVPLRPARHGSPPSSWLQLLLGGRPEHLSPVLCRKNQGKCQALAACLINMPFLHLPPAANLFGEAEGWKVVLLLLT